MDAPTEPAPDHQHDAAELLRRLVDAVIPPEVPDLGADPVSEPDEA
jgi:hypothetical protein